MALVPGGAAISSRLSVLHRPSSGLIRSTVLQDIRTISKRATQRSARHIGFNFQALCNRVIQSCPKASSIVHCEQRDGGFSRAFICTTDDGQLIVAKLPTSLVGPKGMVTNSEVATMKYLQAHTTIPIPKVIDWSDDKFNSVGSEYIIMEHAEGVPLDLIWPDIPIEDKFRCIQSITECMAQMMELDFPLYGSIYFSGAKCIKKDESHHIDEDFCVGPHCGIAFWPCNAGEKRFSHLARPDRGPWPDLIAYKDALITTGLTRLPPTDTLERKQKPFQGSTEEHITLLRSTAKVLDKLIKHPRLQETATPIFLHPDLHMRNIFVDPSDPTKLTSIIDLQNSGIEPAFRYADEVPDCATPRRIINPEDPEEAELTAQDLCSQMFDGSVKALIPRLASARSIEPDLLRLLRYSHRSWRDGAAALTEESIAISARWEELGLKGRCPYTPPTGADLTQHKKRLFLFETSLMLRNQLAEILGVQTDGWVPAELWEEKKLARKVAFEQLVRDTENDEDSDITVDELKAVWPFDLPDASDG